MLRDPFQEDPYPGYPKILFVGLAHSTHTHAWIDLLRDTNFNVRLFGLPSGSPPDDWPVRTYVSSLGGSNGSSSTRARLFPGGELRQVGKRIAARFSGSPTVEDLAGKWLAKIIRSWQPDIIHTLGIDPASYFYAETLERYNAGSRGKWIVQVRGGPDLALHRLVPSHLEKIIAILKRCDQLIADNQQNYDLAIQLGLGSHQLSSLGVTPGTGGINVDEIASRWSAPPSQRRVLLWPKAYDSEQSKALSTLEGLKLAWPRIKTPEVHILMATREVQMWFQTMPEEIRRACKVFEQVPREQVLELMREARVMLAPTLADGIPNSLFEAMAAGAFPIVSPLDTIVPVVNEERNVLFARNLYPNEIAEAIERAMTDDEMVDTAAQNNLALVRRMANRDDTRSRVIEFYASL